MEAVAAIGLASSIITFIDTGSKILHTAKEIQSSIDGTSDETLTRETLANSMKDLSAKLQTPEVQQRQGLCDLARECHRLAKSILEVSESTKTKTHGSWRAALVASGKTLYKKSRLADLDDRLDRCKSQLGLELLHFRNDEGQQQFAELHSLLKEDVSRVVRVEKAVEQLRHGVQVDSLGDKTLDHIRQILCIPEQALHKIYEGRILASLRFENKDSRRDQIQDPQKHTFSWILEMEDDSNLSDESDIPSQEEMEGDENEFSDQKRMEDKDVPSDKSQSPAQKELRDRECLLKEKTGCSYEEYCERLMMERRWNSGQGFIRWLSSDDKIFHISGKLGSGKSTLMKLISSHARTTEKLKIWAGEKGLIQANFFFWRPGSFLQNTVRGLHRSILHDILEARPKLIPEVLPRFWDLAKSSPSQTLSPMNFSAEDIKEALENLLRSESLYAENCVCLFVDGLDEYDESGQEDYGTLVDLIHNGTELSNGGLKICVSSREDNAFMNGFVEEQRMRLHDLNWCDMQQYTRELLAGIEDKAVLRELSTTIPNKSDGIFLWTSLVVKTIRKEIEAGTPRDSLTKVLDDLPKGLEGLFQSILDGLEPRYRLRLFQTITLLNKAPRFFPDLPLLSIAYSFFDDYDQNPEFAFAPDFYRRIIDKGRLDERLAQVKRQVRYTCGGLIEIIGLDFKKHDFPATRLQFTHRSVPDMFEEDQLAIAIESSLRGFDALITFSQINIAAARFITDAQMDATAIWASLTHGISRPGFGQKSLSFLQGIDSFIESWGPSPDEGAAHIVMQFNWRLDWWPVGQIIPRANDQSGEILRCFSVHYIAAQNGNAEFCRWKLETNPEHATNALELCIIAGLMTSSYNIDDDVCDLLFNTHFFEQQRPVNYLPATAANLSPISFYLVSGDGLTIWQQYLAVSCVAWCFSYHNVQGESRFRTIMEKIFKLGIGKDFYFVFGESIYDERYNEYEQLQISFHFNEVEIQSTGRGFSRHFLEAYGKTLRSGERHTIKEWIQKLNLPDESGLLSLLDNEMPSTKGQVSTEIVGEARDSDIMSSPLLHHRMDSGSLSIPTEDKATRNVGQIISVRMVLFFILSLVVYYTGSLWLAR